MQAAATSVTTACCSPQNIYHDREDRRLRKKFFAINFVGAKYSLNLLAVNIFRLV